MTVDLYEEVIALKIGLRYEIQKIYSSRKLKKVLSINFNNLASSFRDVMTASLSLLVMTGKLKHVILKENSFKIIQEIPWDRNSYWIHQYDP